MHCLFIHLRVRDVETGEKRLVNSEYRPIVRTFVAPAVSRG